MEITDLVTGELGEWVLNVRGTSGAGKTTLMRTLIESDTESAELFVSGVKKPAFVYCPSYNIIVIGSYRNVCGGCDNFVKEQIVRFLKIAWMTSANVFYEGLMLHTKEPYYWYMRELSQTIGKRHFGFVYLTLPVEECLKRVYIRNGGKVIKEKNAIDRYNSLLRCKAWQEQQEDAVVIEANASYSPKELLSRVLIGVQTIQDDQKKITV